MNLERPSLQRRVLSALHSTPARIPVVIGACGSGRTSLLLRLRDQLGERACQYVDVEGTATTPERFLSTLTMASPFHIDDGDASLDQESSAREAFHAAIDFLTRAKADDSGAATFLLDEALELRTFESFPGLRGVLRDLVDALAGGDNRFVLTTRYAARARRLLRDAPSQFDVIQVSPLTPDEVRAALSPRTDVGRRDELAELIHCLADGRPVYVAAISDAMASRAIGDPVGALAAQLTPGEPLFTICRLQFELRLHRARGYGALKAILGVLSEEEPLTLTEIAHQLRRTPGSTKDYLSWLEDVDLVTVAQKRYRFADPLLRLWVRLHCGSRPPAEDDVAQEVQDYTLSRLPPSPKRDLAVVGESTDAWGMIEID